MVTGRLSRRLGIGPALIVGSLLFTAPLVLVPLASGGQQRPLTLALLFAARFGTGLGVMILDICGGSIFAALIPDSVRARVNGAYVAVNYGVRPLGSLAGGLLASVIGLRPTLWIVTVGALIGVLWLLPSPLPRLRTLPDTPTPG
jgi:MFS family permease